jgi:hypothetical protein
MPDLQIPVKIILLEANQISKYFISSYSVLKEQARDERTLVVEGSGDGGS